MTHNPASAFVARFIADADAFARSRRARSARVNSGRLHPGESDPIDDTRIRDDFRALYIQALGVANLPRGAVCACVRARARRIAIAYSEQAPPVVMPDRPY